MTDKPKSPFTGLDKALLRSTREPAPIPDPPKPSEESASLAAEETEPVSRPAKGKVVIKQAGKQANVDDRRQASRGASKQASMLAKEQSNVIEKIRKAVRSPGKEVSFVRLSSEEKGQLAEIVYTYKRQGTKTSENEINRIAINYILEDYKTNGQESILAKVIAALLA